MHAKPCGVFTHTDNGVQHQARLYTVFICPTLKNLYISCLQTVQCSTFLCAFGINCAHLYALQTTNVDSSQQQTHSMQIHGCTNIRVTRLSMQRWRRHTIYTILKEKPYNFTTNTLKSLFKCLVFLFECLHDHQDTYQCPKATQKTAKRKSVRLRRCHFSQTIMFSNDFSKTVQVLTVILSLN